MRKLLVFAAVLSLAVPISVKADEAGICDVNDRFGCMKVSATASGSPVFYLWDFTAAKSSLARERNFGIMLPPGEGESGELMNKCLELFPNSRDVVFERINEGTWKCSD